MNSGISELWKYDETVIQTASEKDFANFKSNSANYKIALFNPQTNGFKYLRTLIYQLCRTLTSEQLNKLAAISHRELGNPISITYGGQTICLDYLQAIFEIEFLEKHFPFQDSTILEIGAGYGRTCHAILSNYRVASYDIVDLDVCLALSQRYLKAVLDHKCFQKIRFIRHGAYAKQGRNAYDLCMNIDSMSEMDTRSAQDYLHHINRLGSYFYVKNPAGKYRLQETADDTPDTNSVDHALRTGILTDIIDIWNQEQVAAAADKFIGAYRPGANWEVVADSEAVPWSYHWQALFRRKR